MNRRLSTMLATSSILAIACTMGAHAEQPAPSPRQTAAAAAVDTGEEIIVTARRKEERLQDVPETIDVLTSQAIQDYSVLQFTDIQKLIPGVQLVNAGSGYLTAVSMRGITYSEIQAVPQSVTSYLNDVPVDSNYLFQALYDIGQVEVERGPTGTVRGLIAPSGSITMTTHPADLEKYGGYAQVTLGNLHDTNFQGAFNIPIVRDKFAIRIAGLRDTNDAGGVHSVFTSSTPSDRTESGRISARLAPNDDINVAVTWTHQYQHQSNFNELFGPGAPGGIVPNAAFAAPPAGYNGPPISPNQLLTVSAAPDNIFSQRLDIFDAKVDWTFHGQKLSYVGGYDKIGILSQNADKSIFIPGYVGPPVIGTSTIEKTLNQELRLSSVEPLFGRLDYTIGGFYAHQHVRNGFDGVPSQSGRTYLAGAYGPPNAPIVGPPNQAYDLQNLIQVPSDLYNYAGYGSLTYHFDQKTEFTAGVRFSKMTLNYGLTINYLNGGAQNAAGPFAFPCSVAHLAQSPYPGFCNVTVNPAPSSLVSNHSYHPVVYNFEASHKFNDDLMVYLRTASAFRPGNIQFAQAIGGSTVVALQPYILPAPETSKDYEGGVKGELFDKRVSFDVDYFHQVYHNTFYTTLPFYYLSQSTIPGVATTVANTSVTTNAPAVVDGIEFHAVAKVLPQWTITPSISWANGHLSNAQIPCNPPSPTTPPTIAYFTTTLGKAINTCSSSASTSQAPRWNATLQTEYNFHVNEQIDAFARGLLYYYPSNPNSSTTYVVPAYATVDLYLGFRNPDSQWEVNVYGKNLLKNQTITSEGFTQQTSAYFGNSGYFTISHTPRREFGVTLRYAFGSR